MKNTKEINGCRWWCFMGAVNCFQLCHAFDSLIVAILLVFFGLAFGIAALFLSEILGQLSSTRLYFKEGELWEIEGETPQ